MVKGRKRDHLGVEVVVQPYMCTNGCYHFTFGNRTYMVTNPLKEGTFSFAYVVTPTLALHDIDHARGLAGHFMFNEVGCAIWKECTSTVADKATYVTATTRKGSCQSSCGGYWVMMAVNYPIFYRFNSFKGNDWV